MDKPLLILDLDETLFHSVEPPSVSPPDFTLCNGMYCTYKRPHLDEFIAAVREKWKLAVWTSASPDYAAEAARKIFGGVESLEFVWDCRRCTPFRLQSNEAYAHSMDVHWIKNLKKSKDKGYALERTLILEDKPINAIKNFGNLVRIDAFDLSKKDDVALEVLTDYLETLVERENFRAIDKRNWFLDTLNTPKPHRLSPR